MNLPLTIARRMAAPGSGNRPGVMERIAVVSVALSLAVMILAIAVMLGFKREVSQRIAGLAAHAAVTGVRGVDALDSEPLHRSPHTEELIRSVPGFVSLAPYAVKGGIVRTADAVEGLVLKGVDASYDWSSFRGWLVAGTLPRVADTLRTKEILLSRNLAARLMLGPGDAVEMLFVEPGELPRRDRFRISGIYSSGMDEMDDAVAMTDLRNVQRLADWQPDEVSGYEIRLTGIGEADRYAADLNRKLLYDDREETDNLTATAVTERYRNVFDWLRAHDVNAAVVIVVMLAVAFFNMSSALLVLVLRHTRMIGLLKALGMRNGQLRGIFLYRAGFIALRGLLWGNLAGISVCLAQRQFHIFRLNPEGYLLSEVPVALDGFRWLLLNAGFAAAIVLLLVIPARIVSSIKPGEAVRYE